MYLHTLKVENFRALRTASVSFDATTLLIGENDCGKSSLLEALAIALDPDGGDHPPRFQPHHFHRTAPRPDAPVAGPIHIELRFRERRPQEWDGPLANSPLNRLLERMERFFQVGLLVRQKGEALVQLPVFLDGGQVDLAHLVDKPRKLPLPLGRCLLVEGVVSIL